MATIRPWQRAKPLVEFSRGTAAPSEKNTDANDMQQSHACNDLDAAELCAQALVRSHGAAAALLVYATRHVPGQYPEPVLPLRHPSGECIAAVINALERRGADVDAAAGSLLRAACLFGHTAVVAKALCSGCFATLNAAATAAVSEHLAAAHAASPAAANGAGAAAAEEQEDQEEPSAGSGATGAMRRDTSSCGDRGCRRGRPSECTGRCSAIGNRAEPGRQWALPPAPAAAANAPAGASEAADPLHGMSPAGGASCSPFRSCSGRSCSSGSSTSTQASTCGWRRAADSCSSNSPPCATCSSSSPSGTSCSGTSTAPAHISPSGCHPDPVTRGHGWSCGGGTEPLASRHNGGCAPMPVQPSRMALHALDAGADGEEWDVRPDLQHMGDSGLMRSGPPTALLHLPADVIAAAREEARGHLEYGLHAAVLQRHVTVVRQILSYMAWAGLSCRRSGTSSSASAGCSASGGTAGSIGSGCVAGGDIAPRASSLDRLLEVAAASGNTDLAALLIDGGWPVDGAKGDLAPLRAACRAGDEAMVSLLLHRGARVAVPPPLPSRLCRFGAGTNPGRSLSARGCALQWSPVDAEGVPADGPTTPAPAAPQLLQPLAHEQPLDSQQAAGFKQTPARDVQPSAVAGRRPPRRCLSASCLPPPALPEAAGAALPTSALHFADCADMVLLLLTCRPELRAQIHLDSALVAAADRGDAELVEALLDAGASATTFRRGEALTRAVVVGNGHVVRLLLQRGGAACHLRGNRGAALLLLARMWRCNDVARVLLQAGVQREFGAAVAVAAGLGPEAGRTAAIPTALCRVFSGVLRRLGLSQNVHASSD